MPKKKSSLRKGTKKDSEDMDMPLSPVEMVKKAEEEEDAKSEPAEIKAPVKDTEPVPAELNVRVKAAPSEEGVAIIRPLKDLRRVRIGKTWYSFVRGKPTRVPRDIVPHLKDKEII